MSVQDVIRRIITLSGTGTGGNGRFPDKSHTYTPSTREKEKSADGEKFDEFWDKTMEGNQKKENDKTEPQCELNIEPHLGINSAKDNGEARPVIPLRGTKKFKAFLIWDDNVRRDVTDQCTWDADRVKGPIVIMDAPNGTGSVIGIGNYHILEFNPVIKGEYKGIKEGHTQITAKLPK